MPTVRWRQDQTECVFSCSPRNLTPKNLDIKSLIWSLTPSDVIFTNAAWLLNGLLLHYGWGEPAAIYWALSDLRATWSHPEQPPNTYTQMQPTPPTTHTSTHTHTVCTDASSDESSLTCGSPNGSDENGGHSHDEAPKSSQEREDLCVGGWGGRQDSLKIHLPRYTSKHLWYNYKK